MTALKPGVMTSVSRLQELADVMIPVTIRAVSDLGVADELAGGPRPVAEIASATGAHPGSLRRALRALSAKEIFAEVQPDVFALTPLAELLRSDHPLSLRSQCRLFTAGIDAWARIDHTLRTGEPAFDYVHGRSLWDYLADSQTDQARFDDFMSGLSTFEVRAALGAYPWAEVHRLCDVAGGNGAFLAGLLRRHRHLRGVLCDQPQVVANAPAVLTEAGVADRCEVVGGDFFHGVPAGADAYFLKRIIYSWDDAKAAGILAAVRAAMPAGSRMLIMEPVGGLPDDSRYAKLLDLLMMGIGSGRVRTPDELGDLLGRAGLRLTRVLPTFLFPIVEAVPAVPAGPDGG
jgi:hypothetical protein